jgi:transcriptional regulator with XRE-family HTH domain
MSVADYKNICYQGAMNIGKRLFELRTAKNLSQGDIEKRTGLLRCYMSRVENGHTVPNLETLGKLAKALEVELYQLFFEGEGKPKPVSAGAMEAQNTREKQLLGFFRQVNKTDRQLILHLARDLAKRAGRRNHA